MLDWVDFAIISHNKNSINELVIKKCKSLIERLFSNTKESRNYKKEIIKINKKPFH